MRQKYDLTKDSSKMNYNNNQFYTTKWNRFIDQRTPH